MALFSRQDEGFEQMGWLSKAMSVEEYQELERLSPDRKYEYINGKVYMMSGGTVEHDLIADNMRTTLKNQLRSGPCRVFTSDVQVLLGKKQNGRAHYVYPDGTVSCTAADWHRGSTLIEAPRVVIEALSPGTETRDRGVKFNAYQNCPTVQEIVLVNQYFPLVEVWRRSEEHPDNPEAWNCYRYSANQAVELTSLNLHLLMDDIYQGLSFDDDEEQDEDAW